MFYRKLIILFAIAMLASACAAYGADIAEAPPADTPPATEASEAASTAGPGSATLTIGDAVYEFDNYYCAMGSENTKNDNVPFSSGAFGQVDGVRVQLDASVLDMSGGGSMDPSVNHDVTLDDVEDFANPSVAWSASGNGSWVIETDGKTVTVNGMFDDKTDDSPDLVPGTLEAVCGG